MRAYYVCHYDGRECTNAIPKFDKQGYLIAEPNKEIKKKYGHFLSDSVLKESWDVCDKCNRNFCMSGCCYGKLKLGE